MSAKCFKKPNPDLSSSSSPQLFTPKEAAELLSISPRKLWAMTSNGEVPHLRLGRLVRYSAYGLARFIDSQLEGGVQ